MGQKGDLMAHNEQRAGKMLHLTMAQLLTIYKAGTLASAAAGKELVKRGVALPSRDFTRKQ
jgi:hypothetical protein